MLEFLWSRLGGDTVPHLLLHSLQDVAKLLPFLFLAYLFMEFIEHRAKAKTVKLVSSCGRLGPLAGALLGVFPQCGFSSSAAGLYAGGIITAGTLAAVFLSTSDEMLAILVSNFTPFPVILKILGIKILCALIAGFGLDLALRSAKKKTPSTVEELCEHDGCQCQKGKILLPAVRHTLEVALFLALLTFLLNFAVHLIGEDSLAGFLTAFPLLGPVLAALVGLIPNCASSVVLTQLWLEGALSAGAMIGGLLTGSGIGLLVLFKTNRSVKENCFILLYLLLVGALCGVLLDALGLVL